MDAGAAKKSAHIKTMLAWRTRHMKSYLIFVFEDFGEHAWFTDELFDETNVKLALEGLVH